ncbi:MAG: hypothetical protein JRJ19_03130 [Deltaproteobacteria bacterium]|nr:hypothetical protein [Deltaproteobacteria bacterium]MBW1871027.1 hypothetical protein [Deltaproteobacteria bacterium]
MQVDQVAAGELAAQSPDENSYLGPFLSKTCALGIEELILLDTQAQRRCGRILRKFHRSQRLKAIEAAVAKMKQAANLKIGSSLWSIAGELAGIPFGKAAPAVSKAVSIVDPCRLAANGLEQKAQLLQATSQSASDAAKDTSEWLQSAKELEQRMIVALEKAAESQHQTHLGVIQKMGG